MEWEAFLDSVWLECTKLKNAFLVDIFWVFYMYFFSLFLSNAVMLDFVHQNQQRPNFGETKNIVKGTID